MGEEGGEAEPPRHELLCFHCNFATKDGEPCSRPIKEGWITACSHLLCYEHAKAWFQDHEDCPLCRAGKVKLVRMDLSEASARRRGRMQLIGMSPPEIMEASETALSFWVDQKVFEFQRSSRRQGQLLSHQKSVEELIKAKLREAEETCNALEAEQRALQQRIDERERENCRAGEELKRLRWDFTAAEERHANLQKQVAGERRQELFRRPLAEAPTPPRSTARAGAAGQAPLRGLGAGSTEPRPARLPERATGTPAPQANAFGEFLGAHPSRKLPTFTPGFLGTGRITKRRIT